jgi:uncharacterized protein YkwD
VSRTPPEVKAYWRAALGMDPCAPQYDETIRQFVGHQAEKLNAALDQLRNTEAAGQTRRFANISGPGRDLLIVLEVANRERAKKGLHPVVYDALTATAQERVKTLRRGN